jgi:chemotaxis protein methyltransferase CheR
MAAEIIDWDLSAKQFDRICSLLHQTCGIKLQKGKESLVKSRLTKRLRTLGLNGFGEYLEYLENNSQNGEHSALIDALTTNKTSFFRENEHFIFLRNRIVPPLAAEKRSLRIWSAGCSSGEEPYTIAMTLREQLPDIDSRDVRILATDISSKVLAESQQAVYSQDEIRDIPGALVQKYLTCTNVKPPREYRVVDSVRNMVRFAPLNLMNEWPMKGPFDVIFCRNVMIYFEKSIQQWLVGRFWQLLASGGYLLIGHSESLTASSHKFRYIQPATYMK